MRSNTSTSNIIQFPSQQPKSAIRQLIPGTFYNLDAFADPGQALGMIKAMRRIQAFNPKAFAMVAAYIDRHDRGTAAMINGDWKGGAI